MTTNIGRKRIPPSIYAYTALPIFLVVTGAIGIIISVNMSPESAWPTVLGWSISMLGIVWLTKQACHLQYTSKIEVLEAENRKPQQRLGLDDRTEDESR